MQILEIKLFGNLHLQYGNQVVTRIDTSRLQSVLAYVVIHCQSPHPRHQIAAALWPSSTDSQARTNLRKYLHHLKQLLPDAEHFITVDNSSVCWRSGARCKLDIVEFERSVAIARRARDRRDAQARYAALIDAYEIYRGDLLVGCYDEWITEPRRHYARIYQGILGELSVLAERRHDYAQAIAFLEQLIRQDPFREAAYRHVMRLHYLNGDRAKALETYERCRRFLQDELSTLPAPATEAIVRRVRASAQMANSRPPPPKPEIPLVGRRSEWERLQDAWQQASYDPHLVLLNGVAGIGKTRLAEEFISWATRQGYATAATQNHAVDQPLAYASVIGWLRTQPFQQALSKLDRIWLSEVSRLLPELLIERPQLPRPEPLMENWQRQRLFEAVGRAVATIGQPLILLLDDLHWCDEQTITCLQYLMNLDLDFPLVIVGAIRPDEIEFVPPFANLVMGARSKEQLTEIQLSPLDEKESATLAALVMGSELESSESRRVFQEAEGNPLFIVEMMRAASPIRQLPATIQAVIESRLQRLSPAARALADLASVMGREFDVTVLMEASEEGEQSVVSALEELAQRHLMRERSANVYDFAHDKFREVVYRNLSLVRRRYLHLQAARALEKVTRGTGITAQLAHHYTEAGRIESAAFYRIAAGNHALALSAYREAETHLRSGLELLDQLPPGHDRDEKELALLMGLGAALIPQKGFTASEVGEVYGRAITVVRRLDDEPRLIPFLYSVGQFYTFRQQWSITRGLAERCLRLAQQTRKSDDLMFAHGLTGLAFAYSRHHTLSLKHLTQSLVLFKHAQSGEARVNELNLICRAHAGLMLWILGYPDRSLNTLSEALNHARELAFTHSLAMLLTNLSIVYILRREPEHVQEFAEMAVQLCAEQDLPHWQALALISLGWAMTLQGDHTQGLEAISQGLASFESLGTSVVAYTHTLLADIHLNAGNIAEGLQAVDQAIRAAEETRVETVLSMSLRIKSDLLRHAKAPSSETEALYQQAIAFARAHHAKSFELQATLQLARLQQTRGEGATVRESLARLLYWFTEGFATPDLQEAKALLDELT